MTPKCCFSIFPRAGNNGGTWQVIGTSHAPIPFRPAEGIVSRNHDDSNILEDLSEVSIGMVLEIHNQKYTCMDNEAWLYNFMYPIAVRALWFFPQSSLNVGTHPTAKIWTIICCSITTPADSFKIEWNNAD